MALQPPPPTPLVGGISGGQARLWLSAFLLCALTFLPFKEACPRLFSFTISLVMSLPLMVGFWIDSAECTFHLKISDLLLSLLKCFYSTNPTLLLILCFSFVAACCAPSLYLLQSQWGFPRFSASLLGCALVNGGLPPRRLSSSCGCSSAGQGGASWAFLSHLVCLACTQAARAVDPASYSAVLSLAEQFQPAGPTVPVGTFPGCAFSHSDSISDPHEASKHD